MEKQRYTVTAALPYANGPLHLGHIAGVYLPADIFVRFLRLKGHDVAFICGSDEHGAAITLRAKKEGITPQEIVDKYHKQIKESFEKFNISFDIFHRTSAKLHHETAKDFFLKLHDKGKLIEKASEQFYDEEFQQFLADRYITGTCPKCQNPNAYGDQCEKCGSDLSPEDLINPLSTLSGKTPILKPTSHWYLPMDKHEEWLEKWIKTGELDGKPQHNPKEWRNQVIGQCMSWIDGGLHPRAMTRDLDWGVPVPLNNSEGKVLYVWLDAPIGYISATKEWALKNNKNWEDYWIDKGSDSSKLIHFIGKDNIVFHAIIFPILLKDHGDFVLPDNVPAYEFLNLEGDKFSTSRNWAVWLHEFIERYPNKIDELKYTLTAIAPETKDSEFTWKEFQARINNELVAVLGNFVNRAVILTEKYYEGIIPTTNGFEQIDEDTIALIDKQLKKIEQLLYSYKIREAQQELIQIARIGNKYLADLEPWKLVKEDPKRVETIMFVALKIVSYLGQAMFPFLPDSANKIKLIFNQKQLNWDELYQYELQSNIKINNPGILFEKIEDKLVEDEIVILTNSKKTNTTVTNHIPMKQEISFDDFTKIDLRIGTILEAKKVEKSDKLLQLIVDTGLDKRTIVSGIAEHFTPEEVVGKSVTVLLNLAPRKIRGVESQGMILMAENEEGKLSFLQGNTETSAGNIIS